MIGRLLPALIFLGISGAAASQNYTAPGTGGITQTVQAKLQQFVYAEDYGVVGNGTTDNSSAMQNAVNECQNLGGCTLKISTTTGTQFLMNSVQITSPNVTIQCDNGVVIINNSTNAPAIQFGNGSTLYYHDGMSGCAFAEKSGLTPVSRNSGLYLNYIGQGTFNNLIFYNFPASLYNGLYAYEVSQTRMDQIAVQDALNDGVLLSGGSAQIGDWYISNSRSDANGVYGWALTDTSGYFVSDTAYGNASDAWNLYKTSVGDANMFFTNDVGDTSGSYNWSITSCNQCFFQNVWGSTQSSRTTNTYATGFYLAGSGVTNVTFINPIAVWNNSHGFTIYDSGGMPQHISIINPVFGSSTNGNGQASGGGYGLYVYPAASTITIIGGEMVDNVTGAMNLGAGPTYYIADVQGFSPAPVTCSGPPTGLFATSYGVVTHC